jgi:Domain of unknown function (DUF1707)
MRSRWDPVYAATAGRRMSPDTDTNLRASDAERNEVADKLSRHFAEGRLDAAEFKERLDHAMGSTTRGDLRGLFDDLPRLADETPAAPPSRRRRVIPFLILVLLALTVAGSTFAYVHIPWALFVLVGLLVWYRSGRFHHFGRPDRFHHHADRHIAGSSDHQIIG